MVGIVHVLYSRQLRETAGSGRFPEDEVQDVVDVVPRDYVRNVRRVRQRDAGRRIARLRHAATIAGTAAKPTSINNVLLIHGF